MCIPLLKVQCINYATCPLHQMYIQRCTVCHTFCERASVRHACPHLCTLPQMHETYILRVSAASELTYSSEWPIFYTSAACHINYYVSVRKITEKVLKTPKKDCTMKARLSSSTTLSERCHLNLPWSPHHTHCTVT